MRQGQLDGATRGFRRVGIEVAGFREGSLGSEQQQQPDLQTCRPRVNESTSVGEWEGEGETRGGEGRKARLRRRLRGLRFPGLRWVRLYAEV